MATEKPPDSLAVRRDIAAGRIPPVWLWTGPETYLKDDLFPRVVSGATDEAMPELNVNRYRAGQDDMGEIILVCQTVPMLSNRRVVFLQNVEKASRSERETLLSYVQSPSPQTVLIISGERPPRDSLNKRLSEAGAALAVFWTPFASQARPWVQSRFKDLGKTCDRDIAGALLEACGETLEGKVALGEVAPELEKIALTMGDRTIVAEKDLAVIGRKPNDDLKELSARVTVGDLPGALMSLDGALLFKENTAVRIVAVLTHRVLNMLAARDIADGGVPVAAAVKKAGIWDRDVETIERGVRARSGGELRKGLNVLASADRELKSTSKSPRLVLEEVVINLCR